MSDIENKTQAVMAKVLQTSEREISVDASRKNMSAWDSLAHMNLMLALEDEFGVEFSDQEIADCDSLQLLLDILQSKCI